MLIDMLAAELRPRLRRESIALALPMLMATHAGLPLNEVAMEGTIRLQQLDGRIRTSVATPIGALPVSGRVSATHGCDGGFAGTVRYSAIVRLAARLKGVHLVTGLDGQVIKSDTTSCVIPPEVLRGRFWLADSLLTGQVLAGDTTIAIVGIVRGVGDSAYRAEVSTASLPRVPLVSLNLYER